MSYQFPKFTSGNVAFQNALNRVVSVMRMHGVNPAGRPGWAQTKDGWMPPFISPSAIAGGTVWTLNIVNAETMEVSVNCGKIIEDVVDLTAHVAITDASETFNVAAGDMLWLKLEYDIPTEVTTVTLESGDTWTDYPKCFEVTGSGSSAEWAATYYPLYKFLDTSTDETTPVAPGLHALKLIADTHLAIIGTNYQSGTDKPVTGFTFIPYHRALP